MNDIAPFKPKRMALEPATDPNPDIVFRFFLWLLDFEFLRVMDDNFAVVESGIKAIGPRLFFDRDVGGGDGPDEPMLLHRICSLVPATVEQFRDLWREKGHQMRRDRTNKLPWRYDFGFLPESR